MQQDHKEYLDRLADKAAERPMTLKKLEALAKAVYSAPWLINGASSPDVREMTHAKAALSLLDEALRALVGCPEIETLGATAAAQVLGISSRAVRMACERGDLAATRDQANSRAGWIVAVDSLRSYEPGGQGPKTEATAPAPPALAPIEALVGREGDKHLMRIAVVGTDTTTTPQEGGDIMIAASVWTEAAIMMRSPKERRTVVLAPDPGANTRYEFDGWYVQGAFKVVEVHYHRRTADEVYKAIKAKASA